MFNLEELQFISPKIGIEYRVDNGYLVPGNFEKIEEDAFGAQITFSLPYVGADRKLHFANKFYNFYVGTPLIIEEILQCNITSHAKYLLKSYKQQGFKKFIEKDSVIIPVDEHDEMFENNDDMFNAISEIYQKFADLIRINKENDFDNVLKMQKK